MADAGFNHSEAFLQWIWENLLFDFSALKTTCGKSIQIFNPGIINSSDGPDFKQASIEIDGLNWFGDVEIHTKCSHWHAHGHAKDENFNTVILHVVVDNNAKPVTTKNGHTPFTLNLAPYLSTELHLFLKSFDLPTELPCSSGLHFISEEAFYQQIEKAHNEYFEKKSDDFLRSYDPELVPSKAWKKALILSVWDGLGISHNREAMKQTAQKLLEIWDGESASQGLELAKKIAGFGQRPTDISWNLKSVRPANHPQKRIEEAVLLTQQIIIQPFGDLLSSKTPRHWERWLGKSSLRNTGRLKILFGTVYLPALYVLGNLFAHKKLTRYTLSVWKDLKTPIPASLLKKFKSFELNDKSYRRKLGSVHLLKSYCKPGKCSECFVLKKAIES